LWPLGRLPGRVRPDRGHPGRRPHPRQPRRCGAAGVSDTAAGAAARRQARVLAAVPGPCLRFPARPDGQARSVSPVTGDLPRAPRPPRCRGHDQIGQICSHHTRSQSHQAIAEACPGVEHSGLGQRGRASLPRGYDASKPLVEVRVKLPQRGRGPMAWVEISDVLAIAVVRLISGPIPHDPQPRRH